MKNDKIKNESYYIFDIVKFVLALFVVSIHTNALSSISPFMNKIICQGISRLAVPLFFMISAFFCIKKNRVEIY